MRHHLVIGDISLPEKTLRTVPVYLTVIVLSRTVGKRDLPGSTPSISW